MQLLFSSKGPASICGFRINRLEGGCLFPHVSSLIYGALHVLFQSVTRGWESFQPSLFLGEQVLSGIIDLKQIPSSNYKLMQTLHDHKFSRRNHFFSKLTLTLLKWLVLSQIRMTNRSMAHRFSSEILEGVPASSRNVLVTSGMFYHATQAVLFPYPAKKDVVSHPVRAWKMGRDFDLDETRVFAKRCASRILWFFLVP